MSNVDANALQKTDLDLNTSGNLSEAPITTGMSPDSLSADVRSALTSGVVPVANPDGWVMEPDGGLYLTHDQFAAAKLQQDRCAAEPYPTTGDI